MDFQAISKLTEEQARTYLENIRWRNGRNCPHCGVVGESTKLAGEKHRAGVYKCNACREQFAVTVGTIFHSSHIPLRTWLMAFAMMCASKKGVSALQLQRQLGLGSYQSAWHLAHRVRHAMGKEPLSSMLSGTVEVDETYVGGKPRKPAGVERQPNRRGRGTKKNPVMALVERGGKGGQVAAPIARQILNAIFFERVASVDVAG